MYEIKRNIYIYRNIYAFSHFFNRDNSTLARFGTPDLSICRIFKFPGPPGIRITRIFVLDPAIIPRSCAQHLPAVHPADEKC